MKQRFSYLFIFLAMFITTGLFFLSCKKDTTVAGSSRMEFRLTDAPSGYDAVNIDIQQIQVHVSADTGSADGWQTINLLHPGIYNLLDFRNGIDTLLAATDIAAGEVSQIRLILGNNNSVVIAGVSYPLKTPSAQESGLKLNINATLVAGVVYRLWIDFDAARSIVSAGNSGQYLLKPVIRCYSAALGGSLKGFVLPNLALSEVLAIQGSDTLTAFPSSNGYYFFGGINSGTYNLQFHAVNPVYKDTAFAVSVANGLVTDAGTVVLSNQ